jgi:hypothetical protein
MTKLYITKMPETPGMRLVYAMRDACHSLGKSEIGFADAQAIVNHCADPEHLPHIIGESDDPEAIKRARAALADEGVTCAQDLPDAALERPTPEPPAGQPVSYNAARIALVAMRLSEGEPAMALHHCVLLSNAAGETDDNRGVCMEAASVLLDTFPPGLLATIRNTIYHYTGIEPGGDES